MDDSSFRFDAATDPRAPSPRAAREVGDIIAGRYELRERLGGGGGGTVFRAFDRELGEEVALKLLGAEVDADAASRERVRSEVKLARRIASPHVCRVFDIGEAAGVRFLTMQLIDGESLQALLDRGALPAGRGVAILRDVADGLAAAHAEGILHRDLKPGNVMVRRDGRAVVVDLGLARAYSPIESGIVEVAGTPGYMSPEQLRGEPIAFASDVYSFGVMAWQVVGDVPVLQSVIARTLAARPADRYPSGKELRADIAAAVGDRPRRTWPWLVVAVAIAGIVAVAARPSPPRAGRPSVAVVGFKNLSGKAEDAWLSTASAEMLSTELGAGGLAQFQTLFELYPDNLEYCLKVARGQGRLAKREGYATVDACRALPGAAEDPRVDSVEAQVGLALADHARARQAALTAVTKAEAQRIDGVAKDAYRMLALAEMALGDRAAALTALNACRRAALTVEDGADVQRAARLISDILRDQGDLAAARREAERAAAAGAVLAPEFAILGFIRIAAAALAQGDLDGAERAAEAAISLGADPEVEPETLRIAREQRSQAALLRGDVAAAERWCPGSEKAMCRGSVLRARGDLVGAREAFAKVGERGTLIRRREEPARVLLEAGDAEAAERAALAMADADRKQGRLDQVALDEIVAAEAALAQGKLESAADFVGGVRARAADSQDATLRFRAAIVGARVDAATGDPEAARRALATAADQAGRLGLHELAEEARGALPARRVAKGGH